MFNMAVLLILLLLQTFSLNEKDFSTQINAAKEELVNVWTTNADKSLLLSKQSVLLKSGKITNNFSVIDINTEARYQTIDGFGFTLTGGSAYLINQMDQQAQSNLLMELFGNASSSIGISYLRISIGASDLSNKVFSYNDLPLGKTDTAMQYFSLAADTLHLIPVLKKIIAINPRIKILGTPWSAPIWMKSTNSSIGGNLLTKYYAAYAKYIVKYIQQMQQQGIQLDAMTVQNEPQHGGNNPSMIMSALEQTNFIKNNLGPQLKLAALPTKIIIWDHNCNNPEYPITILNDSLAKKYINGSAFHLYEGDIATLSTVHNAHPDKAIYFTEQWTGKNGNFKDDFGWHIKNVIIGSMRNHSKVALEWNLANDSAYGPHTVGGCTECKGALTITGSTVTKNVAYYIIAHASKFIPTGSVRIGSEIVADLFSVAFITPKGKKIIIVLNNRSTNASFNIRWKDKWMNASLNPGAVSTFVI
jgi:glucosylceramidase